MKGRPLLVLTAIASALLGATVVYLVLSVPNDLRADAILQEARKNITAGENEKARQSLKRIVQQYPRTDAAAAATVALVSLAQKDRDDLARAIALLRTQNEQQSRLISDLQKNVTEIGKRPPQGLTVQAPATKPAPPKASPKKKTTPKKTNRRRG